MRFRLAGLLMGTAIGSVVFATATGALAQAVVTTDTTEITTRHAEKISASGVGIVKHIRAARAAIADKKVRDAKRHTWEALELADRLKAESPTEAIRNHLAAASQALAKSGKLDRKEHLVPIYGQLDETDYVHEKDIRTYLAKAEKGSKSGDVEVTDEHLTDAAAHVEYMEVDLVLDRVVRDLRRAHHTLTQRAASTRMNAADAPLADALEGVHVVMGHASVALN